MKSPNPKRGGDCRLFILALVVASSLFACAPERRYRVLSTVFDGVPTPEEQAARKAKDKCQCPVDGDGSKEAILADGSAAAAADPLAPASPAEKPRPPIEQLKSWEEVLKTLPLDLVGGPDWVKALKEGVIAPRTRLKTDQHPIPPFNLNTLVAGTINDTDPPFELDVEIVPPSAPLYKVAFPHSSHTLWLNCSSCHPGIAALRGSGMKAILSGSYCGTCHGKVSFAPMTSCARCHVNLTPASGETIDAELAKASKELEAAPPATPELVLQGKTEFAKACAVCHGESGAGDGPLADSLNPRPRNFTVGKFKFRSTNSSSLPTNYDLFRTITRGIPGTSMPSYSFIHYEARLAMVAYIKSFSDRFEKQKPAPPIQIPEPPPRTPELLEMGKQLYKEADCHKCHGDEGKGNGPSANELKDDWGQPIRPFDFTSGRPKSGGALKDYFRDVMTGLQGTPMKDYYQDLMTGLQGTPMPDFGEVFEPEQAWAVVYYVYSLGDAKRSLPPAVTGDILFERGKENSGAVVQAEEIAPARFPHWFHRMRVRCAVCHPNVFQMKAGENPVTMDKIRAGSYCGTCHPSYPDPKSLAWPVSFETCARCHVAP